MNSELNLPEDDPMAFEVLYQWLYSGRVLEADAYTGGVITNEILWLRVFKMADCRLVDGLMEIVYQRLLGNEGGRSYKSSGQHRRIRRFVSVEYSTCSSRLKSEGLLDKAFQKETRQHESCMRQVVLVQEIGDTTVRKYCHEVL
jgi:hypothetical protein